MNYVYDVLLNFNKELYDFFDWNNSDVISHIRKILLFRVNNKVMEDLKTKNILVNQNFLTKISNRTEMFTSQNVKLINYACIFTNGLEAIALKFDKNGSVMHKSRLLLDEEAEILDSINDFEEYDLEYQVLNSMPINYFKTRKEREIEKFIDKKLKEITKDDTEKLRYLYYECFNKREDNVDKIILKINTELKNNWSNFYDKVYNFFKLISAKEK